MREECAQGSRFIRLACCVNGLRPNGIHCEIYYLYAPLLCVCAFTSAKRFCLYLVFQMNVPFDSVLDLLAIRPERMS